MTIHQLECFVQLARSLSFSRAARDLCLSQPALSKQIKELEEELGCMLFIRTTRSVKLTQSGKKALTHAEALLGGVKEMKDSLQRDSQSRFAGLKVGYVTQAHVPFIESGIRSLAQRMPGAELEIVKGGPLDLLEQLGEGLDCALMHLPSVQGEKNLVFDIICPGGVVARVPLDHPLAKKSWLSPKDLDGEELITGKSFAPACFDYVRERMEAAGACPHFRSANTEESMRILSSSQRYLYLTSELSPPSPGFVSLPLEGFSDGFDLVLARRADNENPLVLWFRSGLLEKAKKEKPH